MQALPDQTDEPAARRRKRRQPAELMDLLLAAARTEFDAHGYYGATTAAIARRAEMTEAQLFRYFPSKTELFAAAVFKPLNRHFGDFLAREPAAIAKGETRRARSVQYIDELHDLLSEHGRLLLALLVAQTYAPASLEGVAGMDSLAAYFDRGAELMSDRIGDNPEVDPRLMVRVSFAAVLANILFKDLLFPEGLASEAEIRAAITNFVLDGISADSSREPTVRADDKGGSQ